MPTARDPLGPDAFHETLQECRDLYLSSAQLLADEHPQMLGMPKEKFLALMDDLHKALLLKVYVCVCEADREWSEGERVLAEILFEHLWGQRLTGGQLREAARKAASQATGLQWYSLVRLFDQLVPLRDRVGSLETLVMRLANLIARCDGRLQNSEAAAIKSIQNELFSHFRSVPIDESYEHSKMEATGVQSLERLDREASEIRAATRPDGSHEPRKGSQSIQHAKKPKPPVSLGEALAELDSLIGLQRIKDEVRTLTNLLKLRQKRAKAGLPSTNVTLHMVFTGNPGTGKTSVARVLGHIFGAMGILERGHLVETDRSGLVAEYIGQTGPKANKKIDEALGGVLFIDEAYSLVAKQGDDPFGHEAVQTLLKRAEDDRSRLVVIIAGYPDEMQKLLDSNPGLSSRFNRKLHFDDYSPLELSRIFGAMCDMNQFLLEACARAKIILGMRELFRGRDRHFGNGRAVRNIFEHAIRRMANRIAEVEELSRDDLTLLRATDIEFEKLPPQWLTKFKLDEARFSLCCPSCQQSSTARCQFLGRKVRCRKCQHSFAAEWGEPLDS